MNDQCIVIGRTDCLRVVYIPAYNLTLRQFIDKILSKLNDHDLDDSHDDLPNLDDVIHLSSQDDVDICFGNSNLRFVNFQNMN
jgi:hypothetical protein